MKIGASLSLYVSGIAISLALFHVQFMDCLIPDILTRIRRSIPRPADLTVAPLQLHVPVYGPKLPFLGELPGKLSVGKVLRIHGYFPKDSIRAEINLCTDCYEGPMQLHISIRFDTAAIVRNTYNRGWEDEDRSGVSDETYPFAVDTEFEVLIVVNQENYDISVKGKRPSNWKFAHRMPFGDVNTIEIKGQVLIWKIEYTDISHLNANYRYQLNGDADNSALTIDVENNPTAMLEQFSMDLRCECVPQNSQKVIQP